MDTGGDDDYDDDDDDGSGDGDHDDEKSQPGSTSHAWWIQVIFQSDCCLIIP